MAISTLSEIGLRPGRKVDEELLIGGEVHGNVHPRIVKARESMIDWLHLQRRLDELGEAIELGDKDRSMDLLRLLVPSYRAETEQHQPLQGSVRAFVDRTASIH